jgi:hypothetical protein
MARATRIEKVRVLNAAYRLLQHQTALPEAAQRLSDDFSLSRRQAYRYLEQAAVLREPAPVVERTVAITVKLPLSTVRALRTYARQTGLTLGQIVAQALLAFLGAARRHG